MVNIMNMLGGGNSARSAGQKFKRTYDLSNFGLSANKTLQADTWTQFGSLTVPAQQQITFGADDPTGSPNRAGSPVYIKLIDDSAAEISAKIRMALSNANNTRTVVVMEESLERLSASRNDRQQAVLLPEFAQRVGEDSKLLLLGYAASDTVIDYDATDTDASIPVTVYQ